MEILPPNVFTLFTNLGDFSIPRRSRAFLIASDLKAAKLLKELDLSPEVVDRKADGQDGL
jgi:hypothetical protein